MGFMQDIQRKASRYLQIMLRRCQIRRCNLHICSATKSAIFLSFSRRSVYFDRIINHFRLLPALLLHEKDDYSYQYFSSSYGFLYRFGRPGPTE